MAINEHQCLHLSCAEATAENMVTSHCGARNWVTHMYISNGGGVLEDFSFAFYIHSSIFTNYSFV